MNMKRKFTITVAAMAGLIFAISITGQTTNPPGVVDVSSGRLAPREYPIVVDTNGAVTYPTQFYGAFLYVGTNAVSASNAVMATLPYTTVITNLQPLAQVKRLYATNLWLVDNRTNIVIGSNTALTLTFKSIVIGNDTTIEGDTPTDPAQSIVIGDGAHAGIVAVCIGSYASAADSAVAVGDQCIASGHHSIAIGQANHASQPFNVMIGSNQVDDDHTDIVTVGTGTAPTADHTAIFGQSSITNTVLFGAVNIPTVKVGATTNQVIFGATNATPAGSATTPTKWVSVRINGEATVYRLPLYQ